LIRVCSRPTETDTLQAQCQEQEEVTSFKEDDAWVALSAHTQIKGSKSPVFEEE
jgi:hypothetical protein